MKLQRHIALAAATLVGGVAQGQTFFAFQDNTLFRGSLDGTFETFTLDANVIAAEFDAKGDLLGSTFGAGGTPDQGFRLDDAFGMGPTVTTLGTDQAALASVAFIGDQAFGFDNGGNFNEYDPNDLSLIQQVAPQSLGVGGNGLGYDAVNDVLYMVDRNNDTLYTVDVTDGSLSAVGGLGIDIQNAGASFFGGVLYASYQNNDTGLYEVGTVSTLTGEITTLFSLDTFTGPPNPQVVAFAVIPTPGTLLAAAVLGGFAATRRRR